jgi:SulP family sulfate permease
MLQLRYSWRALAGDLAGGAVAALIALPYGLAMASLMGLPPMMGVFTSIITGPITAALGRNPVLIGGTASATVPFIAAAVKHGGIGSAAKVSIVAAVVMMALCVLRLGRHIRLVPAAVISGFSCGIGAMMAISQYDALMANGWIALAIGALTIVTAAATARFAPQIPAPLAGVVAAVLATLAFQLPVKQVGLQALTIPNFAGFSWTPADIYTVIPAGLALAFVASVNILITSRVVDHFRGRHKPMRASDADSELGVYGIVNICAGIFGAPISAGIPARSVASLRCGATTRISNLAHSGFLVLFVMFGAGFISHIPSVSLAAITAYIGVCLLDWSTWRRLHHMRRVDATAFLVTAFSVVALNAVFAVAAGCAIFGIAELYRRYAMNQTAQELPRTV